MTMSIEKRRCRVDTSPQPLYTRTYVPLSTGAAPERRSPMRAPHADGWTRGRVLGGRPLKPAAGVPSMRRTVEASENDYRGGPVPRDVVRVELRWFCHRRTAHAHRWYVTAWLCWRWQRLWR